MRISEFDLWRPGYGSAIVKVYVAGTTNLASIYTDEALSVAASNPQALLSKTDSGVTYGKFSVPLYTGSAYYLDIDSADNTGVVRAPLITLAGQDASAATAIATGGTAVRTLADRFADEIWAADYGALGASASTNTTTITAAIGAAAAGGGGVVLLPAGNIVFNQLTLSAGVVLRGEGRAVTTMQSQVGANVITINGDRAGLAGMTLDGVNLVASSVGVYSKANDETFMDDVIIKRFKTNMHFKGGRNANWKDLYLDNADVGAKLHGDIDAGGGNGGDSYLYNAWNGGKVTNCTVTGVELKYIDKTCWHNTIGDVGFENNTGVGLSIFGARHIKLPGCWFTGNTTNFKVEDGTDPSKNTENTVIGLHFDGGALKGGAISIAGTCQDAILEKMEISDVDITLTLPINNILVLDCIEDSLVTLTGDGTKWTRARSIVSDAAQSSGTTTDATVTKAWSLAMEPGQRGHIEAVIIANQRNGIDYAVYHISRPVHRPGSTLAYVTQTANFVLGDTLTGATSGAKARIIADADGGTTGTLTLRDIVGTFQNNEIITGNSGGSATASGTLVSVNAALLGATASVTAAVESDAAWAADFAAVNTEIQIQVTGAAAKTIEWVVAARSTLS